MSVGLAPFMPEELPLGHASTGWLHSCQGMRATPLMLVRNDSRAPTLGAAVQDIPCNLSLTFPN